MKKATSLKLSLLALAISATTSAIAAESATSFKQAMTDGEASLDFRYRYEFVDQDNIDKDANASTIRTRLNYKTLDFKGASAFIEFDNASEVIGSNYNDKKNGKTKYPVVADPTYTEVNQAYLDYAAPVDTLVRFGRQRINLDNQRFVGGAAWRQNEQTFDAFTLVNTAIQDTTVIVTNISNVNTILGDNINDNNHQAINIHNTSLSFGGISAYTYLLDEISDTYGARFAGKTDLDSMSLIYALEFAYQETDNPSASDFDANYYLAEFGGVISGFEAKIGYEVLASDDGDYGFSTPLGTNHKFNGWADKFLNTPDDGLEDIYLSLSTKVLGPKIGLIYHNFNSNEGSSDYGEEADFVISQNFADNYNVLLKAAVYNADEFATDTTKVWVQLSANF